MIATPPNVPPGTSILSFTVTVLSASLTPSSGSSISLPLDTSGTSLTFDLTKLQSDTALLSNAVSVTPGTYTSLSIGFLNAVVTYCTQTSPGSRGCDPNSTKKISSNLANTVQIIFGTPLILTSGQQTGLAVQVDLANTLTISGQNVTGINFGGTNAVTSYTLPPTASTLPSASALDFLEDLTGNVTSVSGQSITLSTSNGQSFTAATSSSTIYSPNCSVQSISCASQGQVASIDATLNEDGSISILEFDPLATSTGDWVEGVVAEVPTSSTAFRLVANTMVLSSSSSLISGKLNLADNVQVTLSNAQGFTVDGKGLTVPVTTFVGNTDATVIIPGQTIAVHVTAFTAAAGNTPANVTADMVMLRFTRVAASAAAVTSPTLSSQNLPPYFGLSALALVQTSTGSPNTYYDGVATLGGIPIGNTIAMRALYFGPTAATPFSAAKIRVP
jgi:hypothetical protein